MTLKEKLQTYKKFILTLELAGLLHDTGKLSSEFIAYRKVWQKKKGMKDPHDNKFFDNDPLLQNSSFGILRDCLNKNISLYTSVKDIWVNGLQVKMDISLKDIMHQHTNPVTEIAKFLKLGDSVDSAYDRNNPLMAMEQSDRYTTFGSTVFGYEAAVSVSSFYDKRRILYCNLNRLIPLYLKNYRIEERTAIFNATEEAFKYALADTCRPVNDITLWQHSYVTLSLTKIFFLHFLIYGEKLREFDDAKFALIGFGWDGLSFISKGHKIGDIIARKKTIEQLKNKIKEIIEYQYLIGMNVYDDDNGIYFVIPAIEEPTEEYKSLLVEIGDDVDQIADDITGGEIQPIFSDIIKNTRFIMDIVKSIDDLREKSKYPYVTRKKLSWMAEWEKSDKRLVCGICEKRPVISEKQKLCTVCKERRIRAQKDRDTQQSIFIDEIADKNGRLALITAKFCLKPWLNGNMIWSLFVKESRSLEKAMQHLGKIEDLKKTDEKRKEIIQKQIGDISNFSYNYTEIVNHINICLNQKDTDFAKAISFLFDRHGGGKMSAPGLSKFKRWIEDIITKGDIGSKNRLKYPQSLYNFLLTKNHTPSRLLNVWNTTRDFLGNIIKQDNLKAENILSPFKRIKLRVDNPAYCLSQEGAIYKAEIYGETIEIFRDAMDIFVINKSYQSVDPEKMKKWEGKNIRVAASEFEKGSAIKEVLVKEVLQDKREVYPFRIITATPDTFMAIVPADKAVEITDLIYREYIEHFGKVMGRLPFSIGNIFFNSKMPMFVVLDAGRRMIDNFDKLGEKDIALTVSRTDKKDTEFDLQCAAVGSIKKTITWRLPSKLGNREDDFHHPYFIVDSKKGSMDSRKSFFKTVAGDVVHFSDIEVGDEITACPNYYDFEFLDSNTRRYDINLDANNKRKSNVADFKSKPFLLDELNQKIMPLWSELLQGKQLKGITDTKLRNLQSLWLTKYQEWTVSDSSERCKIWQNFVACSIRKEFKEIDDEHYALLMETINNGLFFDTLELYLGILKERIETK